MRPALAAFAALALIAAAAPALAITGKAPPADGVVARAIVMLIDDKQDLCTATVLARDLVLTAAHCVVAKHKRAVKLYQTGETIPVRAVVPHPRFDIKAYARARATADIALVTLKRPLPEIAAAAQLAEPRRFEAGEMLTIAGFGVTEAFTPHGLGIPREAALAVTGRPGSLQIRLVDPATHNARPGLGACTGDSGAPAFDRDGRVVGIVSWTTAANDDTGCGGLTGLTPLLLYREWVEHEKERLGTSVTR
jgi:secreted trypsin-like serine protease